MNNVKWFISVIIAICMLFSTISFAIAAEVDEKNESSVISEEETAADQIESPDEELSESSDLIEDIPLSDVTLSNGHGQGAVREEKDFSDVLDTPYHDAVRLLSKLSVIEGSDDGLFHPDQDVTRAEAVSMVIRMLGLDGIVAENSSTTYFRDVSTSDWYIGYINLAAQLRIINGHGDGTFRPNDSITHEEYIKMLLCAMSLDSMAEERGGYPTGYLAVANIYRILDGAETVAGASANRGTVAIYTYNALFADLPNVLYYTSDGPVSATRSEGTILDSVYGIYKVTGEIIANDVTAVDSEAGAASDGFIRVKDNDGNENLILVGDSGIDEYLGYQMELYIKDSRNNSDVVVWGKTLNRNDLVTISSEDFENITISSNGYTVTYFPQDGRREMKRNVDMFANLIVNGKSMGPISSYDEEELTELIPKSGSIQLLNNDGNGSYETVFITRYENYLVSRVSESDNKLVLKPNSNHTRTSTEIVLDPNDNDHKFLITKDGHSAKLSDLQTGDVVTLEESGTEPTLRTIIYASSSTVSGSVSIRNGASQNGERVELTIDGEKYYLAYDFIGTEPDLSGEYDFSLNFLGEIVSVERSSTNSDYALLIETEEMVDIFGGDVTLFQIVTSSGELRDLVGSGKITFNGSSTAIKDVSKSLSTPELVKVRYRADGDLIGLETARRPEGSGSVPAEEEVLSPDDESRFTLNAYDSIYSSNTERSKLYYKAGTLQRITGQRGSFVVPNDCVIFSVEETDSLGKPIAEEVRVTDNMDSFSDEKAYYFEIYDLDEYMRAGALVSYGLHKDETEGAVGRAANILVIDKLAFGLNEDGETIQLLCGYQNREYIELAIAEEPKDAADNVNPDTFEQREYDKLLGLHQGAAIQYKANLDNEIREYRVLYSPVALPYGQENTTGVVESGEYAWGTSGSNPIKKDLVSFLGKVTAMDDEVIIMTSNDGINLKTFSITESVNVYKYNSSKNKVSISSYAEIIPDESLIFARIEKDELKEIIIIED